MNIKNVLIVIICFVAISCHVQIKTSAQKDNNIQHRDTIYIYVKNSISELQYVDKINNLEDSLRYVKDSFNVINNNINEELFVAKYKLERIKYYTNIVDKKPKQIKFYKGWIKRVLNN